jgi:WD repeat and SOF domain-containing protein 1
LFLQPVATYQGKNAFRTVDHHWNSSIFVTGGSQVDVWDHNRSEPTNSFTWGADSIVSVRFNPSETDVFATTASDRSIALYDLRMGTPLRKLIMQTRTNMVSWNPREAFNFTSVSSHATGLGATRIV